MRIWHEIQAQLQQGNCIYLLTVVESEGSAPGRIGFKMLVADSGYLYGSIGGGIMEFNMVEKARELLNNNLIQHQLVKQVHRGGSTSSSGMICSGSQTISFNFFSKKALTLVSKLLKESVMLELSGKGVNIIEVCEHQSFQQHSDDVWHYTELLNTKHKTKVHLFGAGHVSVPTTKLLNQLGFHVCLYDNRSGINTLEGNNEAFSKQLIDYQHVLDAVTVNNGDYILLMTHKFTEDKLILSQIANMPCKYIGVLGSQNKIDVMFDALLIEGISRQKLNCIHAPVGINISSKTTEEIAVSIAAEIIKVKNTVV